MKKLTMLTCLLISFDLFAQPFSMIKEINTTATASSIGASLVQGVGATVYFVANDGISGNKLWKSDGTSAGSIASPYKYVNDNSTTNDVFTTAVGNNANNGSQSAPYATLTYALSQASEGDTIYVDAGVYTEQVTIDKGITLIGAGSGLTMVLKPAVINPPPGTFTEPGTIQSAQNIGDVHIRDMSVTGDDNGVTPIVLQTGGSIKYCRLIYGNQGIFFRVDPAIKTAVIENNYISVQYIGINCQGSGLTATLTNNTIDLNNPFFAAGVFAGLDFGPLVRFTAFGNLIYNYNAQGILANSYNTNITQNSILGTGQHAIEQSTNSLAFATCNWFGTTNAATIASKVSGLFSYTPYLTNGTNTNTTYGNYSFVPVAGSCGEGVNNFYVNDNSRTNDVFTTAVGSNSNPGTSVAPFATLSYAISVAPANSVIHVDAGTYAEQVIIGRGIVINGAGRELTHFVKPAAALVPAPGPFTEIGLIETTQGIGDVHIRNISVNSVDGTSQNIIIQSGGSVKNCKLLNGGQGVFFRIASGARNANVELNTIEPLGIGINCQGAGLNAIIVNNTISKPGGYYSGIFAGLDFGPLPQLTITNNSISDYLGSGMFVNSNSSNVTNNSIVGTGHAIEQGSGNMLNATCNWYGSAAAQTVAAKISASNINYTPWLNNGTDNSPAIGFQPVPGSCNGTAVTIVVDQSTNVNCNGTNNGSINVTVSGGTAPYLFAWKKDNVAGFSSTEDLNGISGGNYQLTVTDANGSVATTIPVVISEPPVLIASASGTNINCFGGSNGSATVLATGGTAPYTYLWSNAAATNSISSLTAGNYTVTITDASGCTAQSGYEVSQPAQLTALAGGTNVSCFGGSNGSASVTISGGAGAFSYLWNNGAVTQNISNLFPGIYTNTVTDANGCIALSSYEVTQPIQLTASAGGTNVSCFGGSNGFATVLVSGGTGAYSYLWSNGATTQNVGNLFAGSYSVTVTDANGCIAQSGYQVTQPAQLTAAAGGTNVSCFGGSNGMASVIANGGTLPYSYLWSNNATSSSVSNLSAGVYSVTVTDAHGCIQTASYTVTQPALLTVTMTGTSANCNGSATATPAGGTAPYSYSWSNGAATQSISGVPAGPYSVTVTDARGCIKSGTYNITGNSPINPAAAVINVSCFGQANGSITVTGAGGSAPHTYRINSSAYQTSNVFTGLPVGTYLVAAKDANGCVDFVTKIITQPALLTVVQDSIRTPCYGSATGRIYITAAGGNASKSYSWTGPNGYTSAAQDLNNIAAGNYSVTVTDSKGCVANLNVTLTAWLAITITETVTNVACRGDFTGAINATLIGGTGSGFNYSWTSGSFAATTEDISGLKSGNYTLRVTDAGSGCLVTKVITVTQPAAPVNVSAARTNITTCGGAGTITATGSGGTSPYEYSVDDGTYQSSNTFNVFVAGTHTLTVRDANGCTKTINVSISDTGSDDYEGNNSRTSAFAITISTTINARIAPGAGDVDWFKFTTGNTATVHTVSFSHPSAANYSFALYSNTGTLINPSSSSAGSKIYNSLTVNTIYNIKVTSTAASLVCYQLSVSTAALRVSGPLYTKAENTDRTELAEPNVSVFPNPHQGSFNIKIESPEEGIATVELYDINGKKIDEKRSGMQKGGINIVGFTGKWQAVLFYRVHIGQHVINGKIIGPQ